MEGYQKLFYFLNESNKKKFYELFKSRILIYFESPKKMAFIINALNSHKDIKDFISESDLILNMRYKLNKKNKRDFLKIIRDLFTNLDTDKFSLVLDCLKKDPYYDTDFLSDPLVISQFILELSPDKNKIFFESFGREGFGSLIKDNKKFSDVVNILEKKQPMIF